MKEVPDEELAKQFHILESKIDAVLELIAGFKKRNEEMVRKLAESKRLQQQAVRRIDVLLDKIDTLI
ncbi:hypothetical protein CH330_00190 [candidate division WOR-3 bacterium JGI_Cruoil_03_51_56]|uniref:Cell division protein ZapB n=1 Tax=candidate division WOR-3 bacterium JGI_Cruoil_03_51_56 TaxID=1973747 RepID=A0A235BYJ3_UNCW3|nr:MAG: hypothetical protein CH330_00190 [candidate division WOR-3 bacterium JGI_Cruoil_03_51_56]